MRIALCLILGFVPLPLASQLCPSDTGSVRQTRMREDAFTREAAERAIGYFKTSLPQLMGEAKDFTRLQSMDGYYIAYPNTLRVLEGWLLKQDALAARGALDLVESRQKHGEASAQEVANARSDYETRRQRFCEFVARAHYVD